MTAKKRSYDDACGAAHALDLIGERWALLVARELMLGPRRFTDIRAALPGISANVLTQRLTELEEASIVRRRKLPPPASSSVYELTEWGLELEPVIKTVGKWGARSPHMQAGKQISVNSLILSFRTMFDPKAAVDVSGDLLIRVDGQDFHAKLRRNRFEVNPGAPEKPDASIEGSANAIGAVVYGGAPLDSLKVSGDPDLARRFTKLFPMPERAPSYSG